MSWNSTTIAKPCLFAPSPKTLGDVGQDRQHLESLRQKLTSLVAHLRLLAGSGWSPGATTLRTATLDLFHSTAECCIGAAVLTPTSLIPSINETLRNVTGSLRPTPADNLPILTCPPIGNAQHLKSRHPFVPPPNSSVRLTTTAEVWRSGRIMDGIRSGLATVQDSVLSSPTSAPTFPEWPANNSVDPANRLHTYVGRFRSCLRKWGMVPSAACECGAEEPTVDHVVLHCPIHRPPHRVHGMTVLDDETDRMAAEHLPRDLVRPSSGLKELAQTMKKAARRLKTSACTHPSMLSKSAV